MMAHGLSLLIQVKAGDPKVPLAEGFTPKAGAGPDILHYVWVVDVPQLPGYVLLTTV
jgi:hypothetical protein